MEVIDARDCRKHKLVNAEKKGGDARAADGRLVEDALETKVF